TSAASGTAGCCCAWSRSRRGVSSSYEARTLGINLQACRVLCYARRHGADFSRTATIGRQNLHLGARELRDTLRELPLEVTRERGGEIGGDSGDAFAEPLLGLLGAASIQSFDASDYEGATDVWDFNDRLPEAHRGQFTVVFDGGSLEHVFNYPMALR